MWRIQQSGFADHRPSRCPSRADRGCRGADQPCGGANDEQRGRAGRDHSTSGGDQWDNSRGDPPFAEWNDGDQ